MSIGKALLEIRTAREPVITQKMISDATGLTVNFLSLVENERRGLSKTSAQKIADACSVPPCFLDILALPDSGTEVDKEIRELKEAVRSSLSKLVSFRG